MNQSSIFSISLFRILGVLLLTGLLASCGKSGPSSGGRPLVALMSDLGSKDAYVAQMKGSLLSINSSVDIVDLNHDIQSSNPIEASYLLGRTSAFFPAGTIFIVAVDPGAGASRKPILVSTRERKYYICCDNGILTHVMEREVVDQVIELDNRETFRAGEAPSRLFQGRDIFGPVAARLAAGEDPAKLGTKLKEVTRLKISTPTTLGNKTTGQVLHVDRYGNVITNIRQENISAQIKGRLLKISFKGRTISSPFIESYADAPADRAFCLINSEGEFEIGMRDGSAATLQGLKAGDPITIQN